MPSFQLTPELKFRAAAFARQRPKKVAGRFRYWVFGLLFAAIAVLAVIIVVSPRPIRKYPPVPAALADEVRVLGLSNARFWGWINTQGAALVHEWAESLERERAAYRFYGPLPRADFLALSGGGGDGAFGAGLLCGWSDSGTMPAFKLVTGVSTGSMIAPFVFLGGPYIERLRAIYTTLRDEDIRTLRALNGLYGVVFDDALADTGPLYRLISRYVDQQMVVDIADAYKKGRLLIITTASLDEQRPILWNIGPIAASGHPDALELVRKIILASASIPAAFPPVMIDVEANGQRYQEMNVDAGVVEQMVLYPIDLGLRMNMRSVQFARERHAYIVRNGRLDPNWASVNRDFLTITGRAIDTMIHYLGYNDILRIHEQTKRDNIDYNLAFIETDFAQKKSDLFDPKYMRALFDYSYDNGRRGYAWHKEPPNFEIARRRPPAFIANQKRLVSEDR